MCRLIMLTNPLNTFKMRVVYLCCVFTLVAPSTSLLITQGPDDPAPGRSPGPPVNYSALFEEEYANAFLSRVSTTNRPPSPPQTTFNNGPWPVILKNNGTTLTTALKVPPVTTEDVSLSSSSPPAVHIIPSRSNDSGDAEEEEEPQNNQNEKTNDRTSRRHRSGEKVKAAGDKSATMNNSEIPPVTAANDATESSAAENTKRTGGLVYSIDSSGDGSDPTVSNILLTSPSLLWPRARRSSSNRITTQATTTMRAIAAAEAVERIPVATVQSGISGSLLVLEDEFDDNDVNLFCGDSAEERQQREQSYADERDRVLVKLPDSENFKTIRGDGKNIGATSDKGRDAVDVAASEGVLVSDSEISFGYQSSSTMSPAVSGIGGAEEFSTQSESDSISEGKNGDEIKVPVKDNTVHIVVDVIHDVFDSFYGLVADLEYSGEWIRKTNRNGVERKFSIINAGAWYFHTNILLF